MKKVLRLDAETIQRAATLVQNQHDRDDMAVPTYLHKNPLIHWLFWHRLDAVFRFVPRSPEMTILDYGCGLGTLLPTLSQTAARVYGCDLRPAPARALVQQLKLQNVEVGGVTDFEAIPPSSLDCIVSADVLEHIEPLPPLIEDFRQKLKPGGVLVISGPTENWMYALGRRIAGFTGEYHVHSVYDVDRIIRSARFSCRASRFVPFAFLPAPLALFGIYQYVSPEE